METDAVELPKHVVEEIALSSPRRHLLPAESLNEYQDAYFLWLNEEAFKPFLDQALRDSLGPGNFEWRTAKNDKEFVRLSSEDAELFQAVWKNIPPVVVIEDMTNLSMAMSMNMATPGNRTEIGQLLYEAKYEGSKAATDELCLRAAEVASAVRVLRGTKHVVPMPPSRVTAGNVIPDKIARAVADALGADFSPHLVRAVADRPSLKSLSKADKVRALQKTMAVERVGLFEPVLIVDDHYQSGASVNYVRMALKQKNEFVGVKCFAVDKTLGNKDNVSR